MSNLVHRTSDASPLVPIESVGDRLYAAFLTGRSEHTLRAYAKDLEAFAAFLGMPTPQSALACLLGAVPGDGNAALLHYRAHMIGAGLTAATINRRLAAVRSAVKLGRTLGLTSWTPEIEGLKAQAYRDTTGPGLEGTRAMLAQACTQEPLKAARDVALIRLMFDLGLRRGEICGLCLTDLDAANHRLWIKGKGRTQKEVRTLPDVTLAVLNDWLERRKRIADPSETAVFVGLAGRAHGKRITGRGLHHVIAELGTEIGIKTRPHGLRHASITAALDLNGGDVRAAQAHARHANPQTTMRYDDNRLDLAGRIARSLADAL